MRNEKEDAFIKGTKNSQRNSILNITVTKINKNTLPTNAAKIVQMDARSQILSNLKHLLEKRTYNANMQSKVTM